MARRALARLGRRPPPPAAPELAVRVFGIDFSNPVGLAAGFDKDAQAIAGARALGFGFVEVGTVTPKPQAGNPRPRLFRLARDRALINRMGFNNAGFETVYARIDRAKAAGAGPIGVNIGANRDSSDRVGDYVAGIERFSAVADYIAINVSSPNTPGLRALQSRAALEDLLDRVMAARARQSRQRPILLKIAPDLTEHDRSDIAAACRAFGVDGLIVSNTTIARPGALRSPAREQAGGLSGAPLFEPATALLADMRRLTGGAVPLVGVGGIMSPADARAKLEAGARLVQLYTGLVYEGPGLLRRITEALRASRRGEERFPD